MKNNKNPTNKLGTSLIISMVLHAVVVSALIWGGFSSEDKPKVSGSMVQAVVIDPNVIRRQAQRIQSQREAAAKQEQNRLDKLRKESERLEVNRKAEENRIRQLKEQKAKEEQAVRRAEQQRIEKEKQRQIAEVNAAKAEKKRKEKEAAVRRAEKIRVAKEKAAKQAAVKAKKEKLAAEKAEKIRREKEKAAKVAAEKARKEQLRLKRLERERKKRESALSHIFQGLESENKEINSARSKYITSEVDRYGAIYKQLIQQNLRVEDSFKGKSCRINLKLIPTGTGGIVGGVSVLEGDRSVCAATKRAIAQVDSFPMPKKDPDVVAELRNINLIVVPE